MAEDWSRAEVEAIVADHFDMWSKELARERFNKREHNHALKPRLNGRSASAIEFKHANISAVLVDLGLPYIDGYKPRFKYQELLRDVVVERLALDPFLQAAAASAVARPVHLPTLPAAWGAVVVAPPEADRSRRYVRERRTPAARPARITNYLEKEWRNRTLGAAGEEFVLHLEHHRLWAQGRRRIAERIEHVSNTKGDGFGFDILSFETDGSERLIEVKTTRFGIMTPFFATWNEVEVSEAEKGRYHLYRLFRFENKPRLFVLPGPIAAAVALDPILYRAIPG